MQSSGVANLFHFSVRPTQVADELTAEYLQDTLAVCVLQIKRTVEPTCSGPTNTVLLMWDGGGGGVGVELTGVW